MATITLNESGFLLDEFFDEMLYRLWTTGQFPADRRPRNEEEWVAWEAQLERGRKIADRNDAAQIGKEVADELGRISSAAT